MYDCNFSKNAIISLMTALYFPYLSLFTLSCPYLTLTFYYNYHPLLSFITPLTSGVIIVNLCLPDLEYMLYWGQVQSIHTFVFNLCYHSWQLWHGTSMLCSQMHSNLSTVPERDTLNYIRTTMLKIATVAIRCISNFRYVKKSISK